MPLGWTRGREPVLTPGAATARHQSRPRGVEPRDPARPPALRHLVPRAPPNGAAPGRGGRARGAPAGRRPPRLRASLGARLPGWWVAAAFLCGSSCFTVVAFAATFPGAVGGALLDGTLLGWRLAVGAVFFTGAASLQWLEALNGDVQEALRAEARRRGRWAGWRPRNLGDLASSVQLVGTLLLNVRTPAATRPGPRRRRRACGSGRRTWRAACASSSRATSPERRSPKAPCRSRPTASRGGSRSSTSWARSPSRSPGGRARWAPPPARWSGPTCSPWSAGPASSGGLPADPRALRRDPRGRPEAIGSPLSVGGSAPRRAPSRAVGGARAGGVAAPHRLAAQATVRLVAASRETGSR